MITIHGICPLNNSIARIVKIADLEENLSSLPEGHSLESRYLKALEILKT